MYMAYCHCLAINTKKTGNLRMNVTMRRLRATIVAVEKQLVPRIVSVFVALDIRHAKVHAPFYVICGLSGSTTFYPVHGVVEK